jgi:hypothetical protein
MTNSDVKRWMASNNTFQIIQRELTKMQ